MNLLKRSAIRNTFKAYERLKREQHIDTLFHTGKAFSVFPIKVLHHAVSRSAEVSPVRIGFSVPKRRFKSSVDRHRVRRLMVEAWRLNKYALYQQLPGDLQLHVFFIFTGEVLPEYDTVTASVIKAIEKLRQIHSNTADA